MNRRIFLALLGSLAVPARTALAAGPEEADAARFVDAVVAAGLATMHDKALSPAEREQRFASLLTAKFDLPRIARYVLGRYWIGASDDERRTFAALFGRWVVRSYSGRLSQYSQETMKVTGARAKSGSGAIVASVIVHPQGPPTNVEWRVERGTEGWRIVDIDVEGVSMALTEREEIAAVIQRDGGTVAALNRSLADKLRGETADAAH